MPGPDFVGRYRLILFAFDHFGTCFDLLGRIVHIWACMDLLGQYGIMRDHTGSYYRTAGDLHMATWHLEGPMWTHTGQHYGEHVDQY